MAVLSHPIVVLLVGAAVTALITRQWQDRQKEIEQKTLLVSDIGGAVTSMLIAVEANRVLSQSQRSFPAPYKARAQERLDDAYFEWRRACSVIHSRLEAYFSNSRSSKRLPEDWLVYGKAIDTLYALEDTADLSDARWALARIAENMSALGYTVDTSEWDIMRAGLFEVKSGFIARVLGDPIPVFRTALRRVFP